MKTLVGAALVLIACLLHSSPAYSLSAENDPKFRAEIAEGIVLLKTGDREEIIRAIAKFKTALKLDTTNPEAFYWLAVAHSDILLYGPAAKNAGDAVTYGNTMAEAHAILGQILLYTKDYANARKSLEEALRLSPDDPLALFNLGRVYYHGMKDPTAALAYFRNAWQRSQLLRRDNPDFIPVNIQARRYMGLCEYDRGRVSGSDLYFNNAISAFQDVLREQPTNYDAAMRLAVCYRRAGRVADAKNLLNQINKNLINADPAYVDRLLFAEINLQLADIYLKEITEKNRLMAVHHLRQFVENIGDSSHPGLEPAREFLAQYPVEPEGPH